MKKEGRGLQSVILNPVGSAAFTSALTSLRSSLCIYNKEITKPTAQLLGDADNRFETLRTLIAWHV